MSATIPPPPELNEARMSLIRTINRSMDAGRARPPRAWPGARRRLGARCGHGLRGGLGAREALLRGRLRARLAARRAAARGRGRCSPRRLITRGKPAAARASGGPRGPGSRCSPEPASRARGSASSRRSRAPRRPRSCCSCSSRRCGSRWPAGSSEASGSGGRGRALVAALLAGLALLVATPDGRAPPGAAVALALGASAMSAAFFIALDELGRDIPPRLAACGAAWVAATVVVPLDPGGVARELTQARDARPTGWPSARSRRSRSRCSCRESGRARRSRRRPSSAPSRSSRPCSRGSFSASS